MENLKNIYSQVAQNPPTDGLPYQDSQQESWDEVESRLLACGFDRYESLPKEGFDWYDPNRQPTGQAQLEAQELKQRFVKWASGEGKEFLVVLGGTGLGKTELARSATWQLTPAWDNRHSYYITAYEFDKRVKTFRDSQDKGRIVVDPDVWVDQFAQAENVVVDDIGAGYIDKGWTQSRFERLFDLRYKYKARTIIIANLDRDGLHDELGGRVYSRITDTRISNVLDLEHMVDLRTWS